MTETVRENLCGYMDNIITSDTDCKSWKAYVLLTSVLSFLQAHLLGNTHSGTINLNTSTDFRHTEHVVGTWSAATGLF